jgi:hypothetical protein
MLASIDQPVHFRDARFLVAVAIRNQL